MAITGKVPRAVPSLSITQLDGIGNALCESGGFLLREWAHDVFDVWLGVLGR